MKMPHTFDQHLSPTEMTDYQLHALNAQLAYAVAASEFYRTRLKGIKLPLTDLRQLSLLPLLTMDDVVNNGMKMACLPPGQIKRIVSLATSGSSGMPKRLFFSTGDLQRSVDFFRVGMGYMCGRGDRVLVLMPSATESGVGQLLTRGLSELGAEPLAYGMISDFADAAQTAREFVPHTIVGTPAQMRQLALTVPSLRPTNVLLSADYVSGAVCDTLRRIWQTEVFEHYGLTESGLGCAVECPFHQGMHIRHDELLLEIIDPSNGEPLPAGSWGEVVLTTLRREAMPLLRYRTGDSGRLITQPCGCGSKLPRLDRVRGRLALIDQTPNIYQLDELILRYDQVRDYHAIITHNTLQITLEAETESLPDLQAALQREFPGLQIDLFQKKICHDGRQKRRLQFE